MCYFTYKFYQCNHRGEDHIIKCDKKKKDGTGTHCDPDQSGFKRKPQSDIKVRELPGLCRPCAAFERKRLENEAEARAIQRDIERARERDLEEQRRKAEALEAHMSKVKKESHMEWEREESIRIQQVLRESRERQEREMQYQMSSAMEQSRREYHAFMEESYGENVEEGSAQDQAIMNKSKMDWHHPKWTQTIEEYDDGTTEIRTTMTKEFSISESHTEKHHSTSPVLSIPPPPPPPLPSSSTSSTFTAKAIKSSQFSSTISAITHPPPPPPPPPMPLASSTTGISASSLLASKASLRTKQTAEPTKKFPCPPSSGISAAMISESARSLKKIDRTRTASISVSAPPTPSGPVPAFPPVDYSQPSQEQNYGRFMIGTRHQPSHPSQENADTTPTRRLVDAPRGAREPAPAVRLAGSIAPASTRFPTAFEAAVGGTPRTFRAPSRAQRPPQPPVESDGAANELAAIWNRRGIHREEEDESASASSVTPSQSAS